MFRAYVSLVSGRSLTRSSTAFWDTQRGNSCRKNVTRWTIGASVSDENSPRVSASKRTLLEASSSQVDSGTNTERKKKKGYQPDGVTERGLKEGGGKSRQANRTNSIHFVRYSWTASTQTPAFTPRPRRFTRER